MIIVDNAILEIEPEEKELFWEAIGVYYSHCLTQINLGHVAADIFRERMDQCERFISKAYKPWERKYH